MKYTGKMFYRGFVEADGSITDAIIASKRISIDWLEDDSWVGHLESRSEDGVHFSGFASYQGSPPEEDHWFELTLYRAGHEMLLFGTWRKRDKSEAGRWAFEMKRVDPPGE